jgi:REP element-mobilizing transposase RayT
MPAIAAAVRAYCIRPVASPTGASVTKQMHELGFFDAIWQRNYYEHIIRNEQSYQNIADYVIHNPEKWQDDKFYLE